MLWSFLVSLRFRLLLLVLLTVLPALVPVLPGFELAGGCIPARAVGGDFYDWQEPMPGILPLTLGDVMGKGTAAALLMATVRASLRAVSAQHSPAPALELAARALEVDFEASESFVTVFLGRLEVARRRFTYADAGHGLVFMRRREGLVERLEPRGLPLGVRFGESYQEAVLTFRAGDTLVLYSDGLIDVRPEPALAPEVLAATIADASSAPAMVQRLFALAVPRAHRPDDITVVVLRCTEG